MGQEDLAHVLHPLDDGFRGVGRRPVRPEDEALARELHHVGTVDRLRHIQVIALVHLRALLAEVQRTHAGSARAERHHHPRAPLRFLPHKVLQAQAFRPVANVPRAR